MLILICFRDGCLSGFRVVLDRFGRLFDAKTMTKRQREDLWKCLFHESDIGVFVVYGLRLGCQNERQTELDSDPDSNLVL